MCALWPTIELWAALAQRSAFHWDWASIYSPCSDVEMKMKSTSSWPIILASIRFQNTADLVWVGVAGVLL